MTRDDTMQRLVAADKRAAQAARSHGMSSAVYATAQRERDGIAARLNPALHCFREEGPGECEDCGALADAHTGCDCEPEDETGWSPPSRYAGESSLPEYADDEYNGRIPGR